MWKTIFARWGFIAPVLQERAKTVKRTLTACEEHALNSRDAEMMRLLKAHHDALHAIALAAPAGMVDVAPLSGGGPKEIPQAGAN